MSMTLTEFASKGGKARAQKLSAERRSQIGQEAAKARWQSKKRKAIPLAKPRNYGKSPTIY